MSSDPRLEEMLSRWRELSARGEPSSAEELCRNAPDLLQEMKWVLGQLELSGSTFSEAKDGSDPSDSDPARELSTEQLCGMLGPPQGPEEIGRLGHYRVVKLIGAGGMGAVFQAVDEQLGRSVALKILRPGLTDNATARIRFFREARAVAALEHDHVVAIYQVGEDRGTPFLTMPLLHGETLADRLRRQGILPESEILRIGREAAEGLAAAHARGLVHRDVKPANIWLEADRGRVKLLDFGLARADDDPDSQLSRPGTVVGTPAYMAPEQALSRSADARSDLYSLGCVLYRMTTGTLPGPLSAVPPLTVTERNPRLPEPLSNLIMQLLSRDPLARPGSARDVADALSALSNTGNLNRAIPSQPLSPREAPQPVPGARMPLGWVVAATMAALGICGYLIATRSTPSPIPTAKSTTAAAVSVPPVVDRLPLLYASNHSGNFEIVLMSRDGSEVRNLTNHPADDTSPAWSHDGERIAFESNRDGPRNLYLMDAEGGHVRRLTSHELTDNCPSWSPDGKRLVFHRRPPTGPSNPEIYLINADGTGLLNLTNHPDEDCDPAWSPDGRTIAFTSNRATRKWYGLYLMNADGSDVRLLTERTNKIGCCYPAWSPDSRTIAYGDSGPRGLEIFQYDLASGQATRITSLGSTNSVPAWSADGKTLSFVHFAFRERDGDGLLMLMNGDGSGQRTLLRENRTRIIGRPAWRSPTPVSPARQNGQGKTQGAH